MSSNEETYQCTPEKHGRGTFFFTDCGNQMYSVRDEYAYNGCICPKCGKTLWLRGTPEATTYWERKLKDES